MGGLVRFSLALIMGVGIGFFVPRDVGREAALRVAWQTSLESVSPASPEADRQPVPVQTNRRYAFLDPRSGMVLSTGLKAEVFAAASNRYVNQAASAPRWAVQSWDGRLLDSVERIGPPYLKGDFLIQWRYPEPFQTGLLRIDQLSSSRIWTVPTLAYLSATDVVATEDGAVLAMASLTGDIELVQFSRSSDPRRWYYHQEPRGSESSPMPVYAVTFLNGETVAAVDGLDPQVVLVFELGSAGELNLLTSRTVPEGREVRWTTQTVVGPQGRGWIALNGAIAAGLGGQEAAVVEVPGTVAITAVRNTPAEGPALLTSRRDGTAELILLDERHQVVLRWPFWDHRAAGAASGTAAPIFLLEGPGEGMVGIEVAL